MGPTGNDYVIDGLWGRLGVQEKFGETYISGATNGLAVKDAGNKVFLYAGSVNGGIHLRIYDKATDSWGDSWEWISKPGSGYLGSQSIGVLAISDDGQYLAAGQGNPSNYADIGAPSQGVQIGAIQSNGSIEWLPVQEEAKQLLSGKNIRSMEWMGNELIASSWNNATEGGFFRISTTPQGINKIINDPKPNSANLYISKGAGRLVASGYGNDLGFLQVFLISGGEDGAVTELQGEKYDTLLQEIRDYNLANQKQQTLPARTATHPDLINGELISFLGLFSESVEATPINFIVRLQIDPISGELVDYKKFSVKAGEVGYNQASNFRSYGNFSLAADPHDSTGNSVFVGGNQFGKATLKSPTNDGGLVRVDFSGEEPGISETLYGPKIDTSIDELVTPFSPGQPHADSRSIAFYESKTGPKLIQTDDGGIWQLGLEVGATGSSAQSDAWWTSLTTKGIKTLETNMVSWASASNSIASSYQDNASSLGYYGDEHATNFFVGDGQLAFFDDSDDSESYSGYLSSYGYLRYGNIERIKYDDDGFIASRQNSPFYLQRSPDQAPIPWNWSEESQVPGSSNVFILPTEPHAYKDNSIALSGQLNIYETIGSSGSLPENTLLFRPLLEKNFEPIPTGKKDTNGNEIYQYLNPTAIDNQGDADEGTISSLYVGALNEQGKPTIYGRRTNSSGDYVLKEVDFGDHWQAFSDNGQIVDIAHNHQSNGDTIYWIQGGRSLSFFNYFKEKIPAEDQIIGIVSPSGAMTTLRLKDLGVEFIDGDKFGYQALVFVPGGGKRPDQLVIGGLNGIWSIQLDNDGAPVGRFAPMPWQGLPAGVAPGSYVKTIQYDPQDDLLIAGTQGQGSFLYSFSGELGKRPSSNELLHISDVTLGQSSKAAVDKRGNQSNSTIAVQLNSELQSKEAPTEVEIILHGADAWREWMELVSPYDISLSDTTSAAGQKALQYLNILDPLGLEYRGGREENGDIIMPFTFPAGVSLYNLIVNQKEFADPRDTVSLDFSVRTIDGANKQSAKLELVPESSSTRAVFNGSSLEFKDDGFDYTISPQESANSLAEKLPAAYKASVSTLVSEYTITPSIVTSSGVILPTKDKDHATRTTLPIDTYSILRANSSLNSEPNLSRWLAATNAQYGFITYDSTSGFGSRFYDLSGDGYADYLSISANASQTEFSKDVAISFGSLVIQPKFTAINSQQVMLVDGVESDQIYPLNIRINASIDLDERPAATSSIGYIIFNPDEKLINFSNTLFKERAKTLITILGKSVDLSAVPENTDFLSEILINNGQRVMYFEVEGGSLDQLTGIDDPRLSWFETTVVPDQNGKTLALSNANQTALTVNIVPGVQGINPLIADLQNQAPILDFTAFATDQTITGTLAYGREADLDSSLGWYVISRADGAITAANGDTLLPGDVSYIQEALRADNLVDPLTGIQIKDGEISSKDFSITGGSLLAPFAKVSNGETYFAFADANSDGLEHFYSLGTNKIGFEDLNGGGDRDFQDLVQMFDFKIDLLA